MEVAFSVQREMDRRSMNGVEMILSKGTCTGKDYKSVVPEGEMRDSIKSRSTRIMDGSST